MPDDNPDISNIYLVLLIIGIRDSKDVYGTRPWSLTEHPARAYFCPATPTEIIISRQALTARLNSRDLAAQAEHKHFPRNISTPKERGTIKINMYYSFSPSPSWSSYTTAPIDMPSSSGSRPQSPSCAYPSWPRRSSLSSNSSNDDHNDPPSSFISDDDLSFPPVFDDTDQDCTPIASPYAARSPGEPAGAQHQVLVDTQALMRELVKEEKAKKEKKRRNRGSGGSRKSRSSSSGEHMSPIQEANNE